MTAQNDPSYKKFFKMVQMGIPLPAVKIKAQAEGLDPNVLDNPDGPAPGGGGGGGGGGAPMPPPPPGAGGGGGGDDSGDDFSDSDKGSDSDDFSD
jgi:WASH complex subunit CCDC53